MSYVHGQNAGLFLGFFAKGGFEKTPTQNLWKTPKTFEKTPKTFEKTPKTFEKLPKTFEKPTKIPFFFGKGG